MDIQKILFPKVGICTTNAMYFHSKNVNIFNLGKGYIELQKNESAVFDTFFNAFSIGKWKKYTILQNLSIHLDICGDFTVTLYHKERINNVVFTHTLFARFFSSKERKIITLEFPMEYSTGLYCFSIQAHSDGVTFYGGKYTTDIPRENITPIHIGLAICTYKKDQYIRKNINCLNEAILQNKTVSAHGHLSVFIADNAQSLDISDITNESIQVYPNLNVGGTGGFTRALLEILQREQETGLTHVIFTDDDIVFEADIFARTYALLACLKPEYQHCTVGGATLRLESMHIQHTRGDCWNGGLGAQRNIKAGYDLSKIDFLLKNEMEERVQYNAWLFSCVPLKTIHRIGLPLPIFIHRDDVEYGLRNGAPVIHINGIGAWHSFGTVYPGANEYYDMRNLLIVNALHYPNIGEKTVLRFVKKRMKNALLRFRYREADLMFRGIEDYCKGVDWLKAQDPVALHKEITQIGYKPVQQKELPVPISYPAFWSSFRFAESKWHHLHRMLTLNGWIGRSKKTTTVSLLYSRPINFFRVKRALQYNQSNDTGILTEKSYHELFRIFCQYIKIRRLLYKKMRIAAEDYRARYHEMTNENFWRRYLKLEEGETKEDYTPRPSTTTAIKTSFFKKHFPKVWKKIYQFTHPYPYSYRAALGVHIKIIGCWCLKKLHLSNLSPRMKQLQQAKNRHIGERCFIIGNGPSLQLEDLEKLDKEYTFASNGIFLLFSQTTWRPTYYTFMDPGGYQKLTKIYDVPCGEFPKREAYLSSKIHPKTLTGKERFCHINHGNHTKNRMLTRNMKRERDISVSIYEMYTVTNMAIEIAMYMGFREIYLLGVDCDYSKDKMHVLETDLDDHIRHNLGKRRMMDYTVSFMRDAYACMERAARKEGVKIFNATRGGKLEAFERVDFDSIDFK